MVAIAFPLPEAFSYLNRFPFMKLVNINLFYFLIFSINFFSFVKLNSRRGVRIKPMFRTLDVAMVADCFPLPEAFSYLNIRPLST